MAYKFSLPTGNPNAEGPPSATPTTTTPNRDLMRAEDRAMSTAVAKSRVAVKPNFKGRKKQTGKVR